MATNDNVKRRPANSRAWVIVAGLGFVGFWGGCSDGASVGGSQITDDILQTQDTEKDNDGFWFDSVDVDISDRAPDVVEPDTQDTGSITDDWLVADRDVQDVGDDDIDDDGTDGGDIADVGVDGQDEDVQTECPFATACDDGDLCTSDDRCQEDGQTCVGFPYVCNDDLGCTAEVCDGQGGCVVSTAEFACVIDGVCVFSGTPDPTTPCQSCIPSVSQNTYSDDNALACDDGDPCTLNLCQDGDCSVAGPALCDDNNSCTVDTCESTSGCIYANIAGECDDGSACTVGDVCETGVCSGKPLQCNDGIPCTQDGCDPMLGCQNQPMDQKCADAVDCTVHVCIPDLGCIATTVVALCDDGDPCTLDTCQLAKGCQQVKIADCQPLEPCVDISECDDQIQCTVDACDAEKGCLHVATAGLCDDSDPCTTESCSVPDGGCISAPASGAICDDQDPCTDKDLCVLGECVGTGNICGCEPILPPVAQKVISLQIGNAGTPGEGLDVDGNPNTCAPKDACSAGIDNSLAFIAGLANSSLIDAITTGNLVFLMDYSPTPGQNGGLPLALLTGEISETTPGCNPVVTGCEFVVSDASFDVDTCVPLISFDNVVLTGTNVTGGGTTSKIAITIPLGDTAQLSLTLHGAKLAASASFAGGKLQTLTGIIGGALPKQTLLDAINAVPAESLPLPKDTVLFLLETTVVEDVDVDGDGMPDGASMALKFSSIAAPVIGLSLGPDK